jgi:hypothetical protein
VGSLKIILLLSIREYQQLQFINFLFVSIFIRTTKQSSSFIVNKAAKKTFLDTEFVIKQTTWI